MADAHHAIHRQRREFQRRLGGDCERALDPTRQEGPVREQGIEVVAADPPLHLREHALDFADRLLRRARARGSSQASDVPERPLKPGRVRRAERERFAVVQEPSDADHIVDHLAVPQGTRPQELFLIMPPMVHRLADGSTGKNSPRLASGR